MRGKNKKLQVLKCGILLLAGFSIFYFCYKSIWGGLWLIDVKEYWKYMAYSIRGYDIPTCAAKGIVLEGIGEAGPDIVLPWGRLLGNLIYPGFLPMEGAIIYYYLLLLICTGIAGYYILKWIQSKKIDAWGEKENILFMLCLLVMPLYWDDALNTGNMGGVFCIFLILAAFFLENRPGLASFLIAMAMIKPQSAALFMLILLLKKKYKIFFQAVGILAVSMISSEFYVSICSHIRGIAGNASFLDKIISMLKGYSGNGKGAEGEGASSFFTYGILDKLIDLGISSYIVLIGSALLGVIFVLCIMIYIKGYKELSEDWVVLFSIASLGSIFWCYKTPCDEIIIILCNLLWLLYWKYGNKDWKAVLWSLIYLSCINMKIFRLWGRKIVPIELDTAIVADQVLRIAVYVVTIMEIKKNLKNISYYNMQ